MSIVNNDDIYSTCVHILVDISADEFLLLRTKSSCFIYFFLGIDFGNSMSCTVLPAIFLQILGNIYLII